MSYLENNTDVQALVVKANELGWIAEWFLTKPRTLAGFVKHQFDPNDEQFASVEQMMRVTEGLS